MNHITLGKKSAEGRKLSLDVQGRRLHLLLRESLRPRGIVVLAQCGNEAQSGVDKLALELHQRGWTVASLDLVSRSETRDRFIAMDVPLLGRRLAAAVNFCLGSGSRAPVTVTAWGNAAAAGMWVAAESKDVAGVISIAGRPHLAEPRLGQVRCPTLLLVPSEEERLLHMNRMAVRRLGDGSRLRTIDVGKNGERAFVEEAATWLNDAQPASTVSSASSLFNVFIPSRYLKSVIGPLIAFFSGILPKG